MRLRTGTPGATIVRARATRSGKSLDAMQPHVWHVSNGKATEFWDLTLGSYASDEFWS
jgi:ketosteroid isomerase-like protein